jgi:2-oxoglutarate ferredoxin oxidoreductase subunit gamma
MTEKILVAGSGGQGVQFIGKFLAAYGMEINLNVTYVPMYGAEMRGGLSTAQVVLSDEDISLPLVNRPSSMLLLSSLGLTKKGPAAGPDSVAYLNTAEIDIDEADRTFPGPVKEKVGIDAPALAAAFGKSEVINIPFIYHYLNHQTLYDDGAMERAVRKVLAHRPKFIDGNLEFFRFLATQS